MLSVVMCATLAMHPAYANDGLVEPPPSIKSVELNTQDIAVYLGLKIYKYSLRVSPNYVVKIILDDKINNKRLIEFAPDTRNKYLHSIKFSFKTDGSELGNPFDHKNKFLTYEINWDQYQTRSGSLLNFMYGYKKQSLSIMADDFGNNFEQKRSIIKFYAYPDNSEEEKFIAELYIHVQKNENIIQ